MNKKLTLKAFYPHPPERVWAALTEPKALAKWFLPTDFKPLIGFRFRFENLRRSADKAVQCKVLELIDGTQISYLWDDGEEGSPSVVRWTIKPKDGGTELQLEHESMSSPKPYVLIEADMNWRFAMHASLSAFLARRPPVPVVYVSEDERTQAEPLRRAGFRQEEPVCV